MRGRGYAELPQHFPRAGWVEHDPEEIWQSVLAAAELAIGEGGAPSAIGITNQRETTAALGSRDRPPGAERDRLAGPAHGRAVRGAAGRADPRAHGARARSVLLGDEARVAARASTTATASRSAPSTRGSLWKLTGGRVHATDETNASRTLLCSLETLDWDDELLELFGVRRELLPEIRPSGAHFGEGELLGLTLPIQGIAGDQQAALFAAGGAKATYGTGSFVLVETEEARHTACCAPRPPASRARSRGARSRARCSSRAPRCSGSATASACSTDAAESEALAASLDDNGGVYFVPALAGLGSPHWRADARGTITGLTRGTTRAHLVRAALEAAAYQTRDVLDVMPPLDAPARRRRHDAQPLADAVPGRRARHPGRDGARAGADRARRGAARARRAAAVAGRRAFEPQRASTAPAGATRCATLRSSHGCSQHSRLAPRRSLLHNRKEHGNAAFKRLSRSRRSRSASRRQLRARECRDRQLDCDDCRLTPVARRSRRRVPRTVGRPAK